MATRPGGDGGPVFGHGQLRLYLLAVLEEGPRSGYDVIRGLEDRFGGLYSPSAGTVYPRLAKLEDEGLVTRSDEGRRSTYALTEAGRAELDSRRDELAELEESLDASAQRLAEQMRERVRTGAADVRARLEEAARQARARARTSAPLWAATDAQAPDGAAGAGSPGSPGSSGQSGPSRSAGSAGAAGQGTHTGGSGPFVPPTFGGGFPFGQGGTPDWTSVARWLSDVGITPPGGMSGAWRDWADMAGRAASAAGRAGASTSDGTGAGGSSSDAPGGQRPSGVWADATDHVDPAFAGSTDSAADHADSEPSEPPTDSSDSAQEPLPHETGTGWPGDVQVPGVGDVDEPGSADHPATGAAGDSGSGRRVRSEWEEFLGGGIPDSGQLREIGEIIRDAATRIQDVLARSAPRREAGVSGASGPPGAGVWSDATDRPQWPSESPDETAGGTGSDR